MKRKVLKVYYQYINDKIVPMIRLQGKWLEELGFKVGDRIVVECKDSQLIVSQINSTSAQQQSLE